MFAYFVRGLSSAWSAFLFGHSIRAMGGKESV